MGNLNVVSLQKNAPIKTWEDLFAISNIKQCFYKDIYPKGGRGVDRISVIQFEKNLDRETQIIHQKALKGTYQFTPYLEQLQSKGKDKIPRVIAIPTIRDKIVLKIITNYLNDNFQDYLAKDLPNTIARKIRKFLESNPQCEYIKLDIQGFYPSVPHDALLQTLSNRIKDDRPLNLIKRAIKNPTLEQGYSKEERKNKANCGIPQGLSISNILAEVYIAPLDKAITNKTLNYFRFVDDLLIFCKITEITNVWDSILETKKSLSLKRNETKSTKPYQSIPLDQGFEFLGYYFSPANKLISVRVGSYNKFINALVKKVTRYRHSLNEKSDISAEIRKTVFIEDFNERITGAIDGNRRYGWAFFFSEINDMGLLHKIDMVVERLINRLPNFNNDDKSKIKRISRAHYEALHSPKRGYIRNYNEFIWVEQKLKYLSDRGYLKEGAQYTDDQIEKMFNKVKTSKLLKLEQDTTNLS